MEFRETLMKPLYAQTLINMENALVEFEANVPPPTLVPYTGDHKVYRYTEKTIQQAIVQKLARVITGLKALHILTWQGLLQEAGALIRILDELNDDIIFLADGCINGETDLHKQYLDAFYLEEFDKPDDPLGSTQKRPMIPRDKISAHNSKIVGQGMDPHNSLQHTKLLTKTFSGYVHAASSQIMEMYGGNPPHFSVIGMLGTPLMGGMIAQVENQFYRAIIIFGVAARALNEQEMFVSIKEFRDHFEQVTQMVFPKLKSSK